MRYPAIKLILLASLAGLFNIIWPIFSDLSPDSVAHFNMIRCLSENLWQAEFYPRWCKDFNAGLGSPTFLVYYPLSYYAAAIFWPLTWFGVSLTGIYLCSLCLCSSITFVTAWLWLKNITSNKIAMLAAFLYLWMPYRMEVMVARASHPELWMLALLPLLLLFTRQLAQGIPSAWLKLSAATAISMLLQIPTTICILIICGLYLVLMTKANARQLAQFAASALLAAGMILFFLVPAQYYRQFLIGFNDDYVHTIWVMRHVMLSDFMNKPYLMFNLSLTVLFLLLAGIKILRAKNKITDDFVRKESLVIMVCVGAALFLLSGLSQPLWNLIRAFGIPGTPWRIQAFLGAAIVYFIAIYAHYLISEKRRKTWQGDYITLFLFILFISMPLNKQHTAQQAKAMVDYVDAQLNHFREFHTKWTVYEHYRARTILDLHQNHPERPLAEFTEGSGTVNATWKNDSIFIEADSKTDAFITLEHFYYPSWQAYDATGNSVTLKPNEVTGRMMLEIPAGDHKITITHKPYASTTLLQWCRPLSFVALLLWLVLFIRQCRAARGANAAHSA